MMKLIAGVGIGALIGAAIAILFAPKWGAEARAGFTDRVNDGIKLATAKAREIARETTEVVAHLNDQAQSVRGALDAGVRAFREARTLYRL